MLFSLAWLYWDPPKNVFTVPFLDRPIAWYGVLFVLGFICGYFIIISMFTRFLQENKLVGSLDILNGPHLAKKLGQPFPEPHSSTPQLLLTTLNNKIQKENIHRDELVKIFPNSIASAENTAYRLTDYLCWFVVLGTLIGARLGVVFFYDWPYFQSHPIDILKVWEGGLASHGGTIGLLSALFFYTQFIKKKVPSLTYLRIIDFVAVPTALAGCFIRLGNFVNQEISGIPSTVPWAVIFGHPIDGSPPLPRHPVQLYEAACYLAIFVFLCTLWRKKGILLTPGTLSGLVLILIFSSRFVLEFWKSHQASFIDVSTLQVGQLLSLPFIALGFFIIWIGKRKYPLKPVIANDQEARNS